MFQYIELIISTLTSPQVIFLGFIVYVLLRRPDIIDRIRSMKLFGAEIDLAHIEQSLENAVSKIDHLEEKIDSMKDDYISKFETEFDPIAPAQDLHKLGTELKAIAAALDSIDFVEKYLHLGSNPDAVYAAGCAIQVRPQPKFLEPLVAYLSAITGDPDLGEIQLLIGFKLLQCVEKVIATDGRREHKVISAKQIQKTIGILDAFAVHPICAADVPRDGKDGIPSKVEKLKKKFLAEINKRKVEIDSDVP